MKPADKPARPTLTASQVKALLLVASDSSLQQSTANVSEVEGLLAEMNRVRGEPRTDLLATATDQSTPVQELIRIKDLAKVFMKHAEDSRHREAARLLYHATVAAAFVHHAAAISGRPMHKQVDLYERFAQSWAEHPMGELFREAVIRVTETKPPDPQ